MRKVYIGKADLDLIGCGYILGVSCKDEVITVRGEAPEKALQSPETVCIECGGSGQVELLNFDHHGPGAPRKSATLQAFEELEKGRIPVRRGTGEISDKWMVAQYINTLDIYGPERFRNYAKKLDIDPGELFPSLSDVISGMMLSIRNPKEQFFKGIEILQVIEDMEWEDVFHPKFTKIIESGAEIQTVLFGPIKNSEFEKYVQAKQENDRRCGEAVKKAQWTRTKGGRKLAYLETSFYGAPGALYALGAEIVVVLNPNFRGLRKFTIAGNGIRVEIVKPLLDKKEPGWGGPSTGTIIGSPQDRDSILSLEEIVEIVKEHF